MYEVIAMLTGSDEVIVVSSTYMEIEAGEVSSRASLIDFCEREGVDVSIIEV